MQEMQVVLIACHSHIANFTQVPKKPLLYHFAVLQTLFHSLQSAHSDPKVVAIVITGANGKFSGGFDISQFQKQEGGAAISEMVTRAFLDLVETGPKPTVAALSTIALGGGCELAVSCNARVATPGASLTLITSDTVPRKDLRHTFTHVLLVPS
jgi:enoyl-CoA hydratase/carnithine racemase